MQMQSQYGETMSRATDEHCSACPIACRMHADSYVPLNCGVRFCCKVRHSAGGHKTCLIIQQRILTRLPRHAMQYFLNNLLWSLPRTEVRSKFCALHYSPLGLLFRRYSLPVLFLTMATTRSPLRNRLNSSFGCFDLRYKVTLEE